MILTPEQKKIIEIAKNKTDFSLDEIFQYVTSFKPFVDKNKNIVFLGDNTEQIAFEINLLNISIMELVTSGVLGFRTNTEKISTINFINPTTHEIFDVSTDMVMAYSKSRYYKTDWFSVFIKNGFRTRTEVIEQKERRIKSLKDWIPIIVTVAGLLLSSVPSWIQIFNHKNETVTVSIDNNTLMKIDALYQKIDQLQLELSQK
ncbi:hypothetical protein TREVI0001_2547 [Treponema vincentii ATCC 35580]|uniref:Uncharacterized protein n=1 Tax=Treponema vincentii ATCC 35580 TaxID=596324 RepID=C8PSJ9_9SPIR|nr:hypothetical protein [Treponema vincentii]EEV19621.1 hypothetical protein TREVI0001_2547 [Treponema vincentii ATCC 35580]